MQELSFRDVNDNDIIAVLTAQLSRNRTFLEARMLKDIREVITFESIFEELKGRKEVLQKILLNQDCRLLRFAIANKKIEAFKTILGAVKDDKEILKEILTSTTLTRVIDITNVFNYNLYHYFVYNHYTPLELCTLSYSYCNEKVEFKEFIEAILDSARKNEILEDALTDSGTRKDLAKKLSDEKYSNDVIIDVLQKNQKAEERCEKAGVISLFVALPSLVFICKKFTEIDTGWSIAIGIVGAIAVAYTISYCVYELSLPSTKMLEAYANQKVSSEVTVSS